MLRFGFGDRLHNADTKSAISIKGKLRLKGSGVHAFGPGLTLCIGKYGVLTIGDNFTASVRNRVFCEYVISIGDDNMWSFDNVVMDTDSHQICNMQGDVMNYNKEIIFGNHVWLGCRNIILKGTVIPNGCVVASGSKISGVYEKKDTIITSHGKVIKSDICWKRTKAINNK